MTPQRRKSVGSEWAEEEAKDQEVMSEWSESVCDCVCDPCQVRFRCPIQWQFPDVPAESMCGHGKYLRH